MAGLIIGRGNVVDERLRIHTPPFAGEGSLDAGLLRLQHFDRAPNDEERAEWLFQVLPDGIWKGRRCFIVGGGPSVKKFDLTRLRGELVIALNNSFAHIDYPTILFSIDDCYWGQLELGDKHPTPLDPAIIKAYKTTKAFKVWVDITKTGYPSDDILKVRFVGHSAFSQSLYCGLGCGENTGYAAINLAYCLGVSELYLLGYDMQTDADRTHWHEGYGDAGRIPNMWTYKRFLSFFPHIKNHLECPMRIINLNPDSALREFAFGKQEDIPHIKRPLVVSFYTTDGYEEIYKSSLEFGLRRFGLEHDVEAVAPFDSWYSATRYKAEFIQRKLCEHPDRDILWLDVDSRIVAYPALFDDWNCADVGVHKIDWSLYSGISRNDTELDSAVMYFRNNSAVRSLLKRWIEINKERAQRNDILEQRNLDDALQELNTVVSVVQLPAEYCCIFDLMRERVEDPVILQMQASRQTRDRKKLNAN